MGGTISVLLRYFASSAAFNSVLRWLENREYGRYVKYFSCGVGSCFAAAGLSNDGGEEEDLSS